MLQLLLSPRDPCQTSILGARKLDHQPPGQNDRVEIGKR
jgi:hypothetical protein